MKLKYACIPPEDLEKETSDALAAEAKTLEDFERAKEQGDVSRMFELMDIWEATHVRAFRLKNITAERLDYEKRRAANDIIATYRRYLEARNDEEDSIVIELFREWGKALITAKELSIQISPNDFSIQAASLIDSVLGEALKHESQIKMGIWYRLFANTMSTLSRLQIPESEIDRVRIFGTRRLRPFGG